MFVCSVASAAVGVREETTGANIQATDIALVGAELTVTQSGSVAVITLANPVTIEADTPDSVTLAESGTTFVATSDAAGGRTFLLPTVATANNGTWFKFVGGTGTQYNRKIVVTPSAGGSSSIYLTAKGTALASIRALNGDIGSDSYPTVTVMSIGTDWYVIATKGTWEAGS